MSEAPRVTDNQAASRFELTEDGQLAELQYRLRGQRLVLIHAGVPDAISGRGNGGRLMSAAVDRAAKENLTIAPLCPFARSWLQRNPDQAARATIDWSRPQGTA